ncbi:MAG: DUF2442 domain-containing protein [Thiobacillaceae bacterium]|jgi:hypothetical protein|nr:DUF2442 domain-containing protein [Hydrogenophilales bacterium]MBP9914980.1 DUF2442 domain-containing protein [Thiobacillaceae bacterium]
MPAVINVVAAELVGELKLRVRFDDGTEQTIEFKPFLTASLHPDIRAWSSPERFSRFRVEHGELLWGDYELCFPVMDLYRNRIDHNPALEAAA